MRALVVDDSRAMRRILSKILREVGFDEVLEAGHGLEALDVLREHGTQDLALVDWNMPEMTGYDFVRLVRTQRIYDPMRLMMVTTESETERVVAALEAGADEYVMKPFSSDIIREKLELLGISAGR
ncbi:MAG: response regulator [Myxococcales bacterium]|nr:response regulator [Myxococcales bacterium]